MKIALLLFFLSTNIFSAETKIIANISGTVSEVAAIQKILPVVQKIINSDEFKQKILSSKFTYTKLDNSEIYKTITSKNWELNLAFEKQGTFNPFKKSKCTSKVLGWTYPNVKTVWFNRCNFQGRSASGIAGTIAHETMHKIGFSHPFKATKTRPQSVPYSVGTICANLYGKYENK